MKITQRISLLFFCSIDGSTVNLYQHRRTLECESFQLFCSFFYRRALLIFQSYRSSENCRVNWNSRSFSRGLINISFLPQFLTLSLHRRTSKSHTKNIYIDRSWGWSAAPFASIRSFSLPPHPFPFSYSFGKCNLFTYSRFTIPQLTERSRTHVWASKWWKKNRTYIPIPEYKRQWRNFHENPFICLFKGFAFLFVAFPFIKKWKKKWMRGGREWEWRRNEVAIFMCFFVCFS